jgi:hypothetical protein
VSETPTDTEIHRLLHHLQRTPRARDAWIALQRYRTEALAGARDGVDRQAKERLVAEARERLRSLLLHLLVNGQTVGPAVDYVVGRTQVKHDQAVQEQAIRWQAVDAYREMFRRELNVLDMDNFPAGHVALMAATNNLALRRLALEDELLTELARIHGEAKRKIGRLLEDLEDAGGDDRG